MSKDGPAFRRMDADARRGALVEIARALFAAHGYEPLSMAQIARAAGISKPLLYHYFPSKQALFAAALEETARELTAALRPDPSRPPTDQLAVTTWLWSVEGACLTWVEGGLPVAPAELQGVLLGSLGGSLMGAGER